MKQIVYVACPESQQLYVWQLNFQGDLALLQTVDVPGQGQPIAIHPNKTHLYLGVRPTSGVVSYSIKEDGRLEQVAVSALDAGPTYISTDLTGRFLFAVSYGGNCASVSLIGTDDTVGAIQQRIEGVKTPHSANIDPLNQYLLMPCLTEDKIHFFKLEQNGELVKQNQAALSTAKGAGPRHMAFHPNGRFAYSVNELDSTVDVWAINANNGQEYKKEQTISLLPAGFDKTCWAADIHITPDGQFLYACERSASIITAFRVVDAGNKLAVVGHYDAPEQPRGFNIDNTGRYLICAGQKSEFITVYGINQLSAELTALKQYPVGKGAMWVTVLTL